MAISLCVHSPALDLLPTGLVLELQTAFWVWSHLAFLLIEFLTYFFYPMNRIYHFTYMYFLSPSFSLSPSLFLTHTHTHTHKPPITGDLRDWGEGQDRQFAVFSRQFGAFCCCKMLYLCLSKSSLHTQPRKTSDLIRHNDRTHFHMAFIT